MKIQHIYFYKDSQGRLHEYNYPLTETEMVNRGYVYSHSCRQEY